jgi:hypothetical protein
VDVEEEESMESLGSLGTVVRVSSVYSSGRLIATIVEIFRLHTFSGVKGSIIMVPVLQV